MPTLKTRIILISLAVLANYDKQKKIPACEVYEGGENVPNIYLTVIEEKTLNKLFCITPSFVFLYLSHRLCQSIQLLYA